MFQDTTKNTPPATQERVPSMVEPIEKIINRVFLGDCTEILPTMPSESVDLVLTDPPYLVSYASRDGRNFRNDDPNDAWWVEPAYREMYRMLKPNRFCVSFYGWGQVEKFMTAWKAVGFRPVGHLVFVKRYASREGYTKACHELAYVLAKGRPEKYVSLADVLAWRYSGNELHPTQKDAGMLEDIIRAYSLEGDIVLDPFAGSGSTLLAARQAKRHFIGIELETEYAKNAVYALSLAR